MKKIISTILLGVFFSAPTFAADERTTMAVESRQGIFEVIRMYFGPVYGMVRGQIPFDGDVVTHNANKIGELAGMISDGFRHNTAGADVETEALDSIWDNLDDFNGKAATLAERAGALAAAGGQDLDATRAAFQGLGGACKACHDDYRQQE